MRRTGGDEKDEKEPRKRIGGHEKQVRKRSR